MSSERGGVSTSCEFKIKLGGLVVIALFVIISLPSFVLASPLYTPGQTLNPSCLPTNPDCTVSPSAYTGMPSFGIGTTTPSQQLSVVGQQSLQTSSVDSSIVISNHPYLISNGGDNLDLIIGNNLVFTAGAGEGSSVLLGNNIETGGIPGAANSYFNILIGYGVKSLANEPKNIVIGATAQASSSDSVAVGYASRVGRRSIAIGSQASAPGDDSAAFGSFLTVSGNNIFGYGKTTTRNWFAGTVGIGTTTPSSKLSITQSANTSAGGLWLSTSNNTDYRSMFMDTSGVLSFTGGDTAGVLNTATLNAAGAWTNASDIAYKENIVDLSTRYGLDTVLQTQPRFYTMKGDTHIPQVGFIAQELELVIPEVVDGEDGSKGISYGNLVAVAFQAIKDLVHNIATELFTKKLHITEQICIDDECYSKEALRQLLRDSGAKPIVPLSPPPDSVSTLVSSSDPISTTTSSTPPAPDSIATTTDSIPNDTSSLAPIILPEPPRVSPTELFVQPENLDTATPTNSVELTSPETATQ
ncbi:MAG: tail fiber domain-containing protein [Candidatus Taylorbacteria bacterium]